MIPSSASKFSRRTVLKGALGSAALLSSTAFSGTAWGQTTGFDFEALTMLMQARAQAPFTPAPSDLSPPYAGLDYDGYRMIQFDTDQARWRGADPGYEVHAFPPGWLYPETVSINEVTDGVTTPMAFSAADFRFFDAEMAEAAASAPFPGVAGFRLNYPVNHPHGADELISFLGASYFRALGRGNIYGLSARGLVINSWRDGAEEFPRFTEFWLERPSPGKPLAAYAALDSDSVTGAYRFEITPASDSTQETVVDVTARLFFRKDVAELGIAPLTSMFLFAETNRNAFDDYRPRVHDSNGLLFETAKGEVRWRPLNNGADLGNSYLYDPNVRAFGLYQRGRDFDRYQDAGAHYERRPSLRVEPGDWGPGHVRLIEIPARSEADDNIVAFWIPEQAPVAGEEREYSYRLRWGDLDPDEAGALAHVVETRAGQGGIAAVENAPSLRKFVIDFAGGPLADPASGALYEIAAEATAGHIVNTTFSQVPANGLWRLVLDVETDGAPLIELRARVFADGVPATETWIYQWRGTPA
ncbi:glucan biosynthesis protein [Devosia sp.]|uniref:glucan biosynthesis protein n=1 Tax=Devosia sp. TaxID=1871048 RepID=UPI003A9051FB